MSACVQWSSGKLPSPAPENESCASFCSPEKGSSLHSSPVSESSAVQPGGRRHCTSVNTRYDTKTDIWAEGKQKVQKLQILRTQLEVSTSITLYQDHSTTSQHSSYRIQDPHIWTFKYLVKCCSKQSSDTIRLQVY